MKEISLLVLISIILIGGCAKKVHDSEWSFQTGGPIFSHPVLDNNTLYFGSNDSSIYALDTQTKEPRWVFSTTSPIQSKALVNKNAVYFTNGNSVYAIDNRSGEELWKYNYSGDSTEGQIDPWDYHHGSPVVVGETIYFGLGDGNFYGFAMDSGEMVDQFTAIDSAVIRCAPASSGAIIFFGDWNGIVYAYDTVKNDTVWTYKTYAERLYDTFGQLNSEFIVNDSLLIFGARNPELQILNIKNGQRVWNYISPERGWISGDPVVLNDTLYIAGSDNHKLFAFDVRNGSPIWEFEFLFNNFSKPLIMNDQILITTGDANSAYRADDGMGYLYSVDRSNGQLRNFTLFDANVFSTPAIDARSIYVASEDQRIYALDRNAFLHETADISARGYYSIELLETSIPSFHDSVTVSYRVNFETPLEISMYDLGGTLVQHWPNGTHSHGDQTLVWNGRDERGEPVSPGYYYFELKADQFYQTGYVQKLE